MTFFAPFQKNIQQFALSAALLCAALVPGLAMAQDRVDPLVPSLDGGSAPSSPDVQQPASVAPPLSSAPDPSAEEGGVWGTLGEPGSASSGLGTEEMSSVAATAHTDGAAETHSDAAHADSWLGLDGKGWVAIGTLLFVLGLLFLKAPAMLAGLLDARIAKIKAQLADANRLRAEAAALMQEYEAKRIEAEAQAAAIITHAEEEAAAMIALAKVKVAELTTRRRASAEAKIASAERAAVAEIRALSVDAAVKASTRLIQAAHVPANDARLVAGAIESLTVQD